MDLLMMAILSALRKVPDILGEMRPLVLFAPCLAPVDDPKTRICYHRLRRAQHRTTNRTDTASVQMT